MAPAEVEIIRSGKVIRRFTVNAGEPPWQAKLEDRGNLLVTGKSGSEAAVDTPKGRKPVLTTTETYSPRVQSFSLLPEDESKVYPLEGGTVVKIIAEWRKPKAEIEELRIRRGDKARVTAVSKKPA
jgi:hypothetical protein